tara:strand:+ start:318 stop:1016 length:699 start_codon:yes stop_codon:yes gene_type:complete
MIHKNTDNNLELIIGYNFKNKQNLKNSLFHPSYSKNKSKKKLSQVNEFERLEFLGDRVLGLAVSSLIFKKFQYYDEGNLTKKLSYLVQKDFLYKIALELKLERVIQYSNKKNNIRTTKSILSDSVESLIGSIFVDGGYIAAFKVIKNIWTPYLDVEESNQMDPKTKLQEISQHKLRVLPEYKLIKRDGPSHSPIFTVSLKALNMKTVKASGSSKRDAEKNAAKKILELISEN